MDWKIRIIREYLLGMGRELKRGGLWDPQEIGSGENEDYSLCCIPEVGIQLGD